MRFHYEILGDKEKHKVLKEAIGEARYEHSLGVAKTAIKLAQKYNCSERKAAIAGLLHDCGKLQNADEILKKAKDFGIIQDDVMKNNRGLLHGPVGAVLAKIIYEVEDEDILNAINIHTTGKANMTLLEKIIYLADYIEPGRIFSGVDDIRRIAYVDLDKALLLAMGSTIKYVIDKGLTIHIDTIKARNSIIFNLKDK
ncbi:bis(5'-nucleosyl)-tetraphosphatase (symmetrical) YqeK [Sporosalibacterium faouarense]|uniref:bis(5'-nucleosyl)-tetraphosphatase (symmetrical) YqeK n=1 Tax=Sporosalibacterium faouarense TaxID=516123 RepID=UPI00141CACBA|nr:bis(5'-nucleosyl)-tetraphosphatase (symmetrical) YqeK [Sporosalibacterium faouarense]MTI48488.1 HD domain-containing protein [Bacillota bacterium]